MIAAPVGQWTNTANRSADPPKALIVTGNSLLTKTDIIKRIETLLRDKEAHAGTCGAIDQHASVESIGTAMEMVKQSRANVLLAVGGGSPIDAAKAVAYWTYEAAHGEGAFGKTQGQAPVDERNVLPIVAIPTTLSLAETTQNAGFTKDGKKTGVSHPALVPRAILYDAELTLPTPERLWLSTGLRALDHAIESLYRPDPSPVLRNQWLGAIRDLFHFLPASQADPSNLALRQRLQLAAYTTLAPEARRGALGLSHALGHALGATYAIPHGITSCLTLASAIELTASSHETGTEQLDALADALDFIPAPYHEQAGSAYP